MARQGRRKIFTLLTSPSLGVVGTAPWQCYKQQKHIKLSSLQRECVRYGPRQFGNTFKLFTFACLQIFTFLCVLSLNVLSIAWVDSFRLYSKTKYFINNFLSQICEIQAFLSTVLL